MLQTEFPRIPYTGSSVSENPVCRKLSCREFPISQSLGEGFRTPLMGCRLWSNRPVCARSAPHLST